MEKSINRKEFFKVFDWFLQNFELTREFLNDLWSHDYFVHYHVPFMALSNNPTAQKTFILTELTRERFTCKVIIEKLKNCGQVVVAEALAEFNKSIEPIPLSNEVAIDIWLPLSVRETFSNAYPSHRYPRGKCVIVNYVEDPQTGYFDHNTNTFVELKGLKKETERFRHVFTQLLFDVITADQNNDWILNKMSANRMKSTLADIRDRFITEKDEAFVLIIISHGQNDCIYGYDACKAIREKNTSGNITDEQYSRDLKDEIPIKELVSLFSEKNCPQLKDKPKLFFNICCRIIADNNGVPTHNTDGSGDSTQSVKIGQIVSEHICDHNTTIRDTFICYSCALGYETYFDTAYGFTYFGQAFTHAIAQYACDQPLYEIMNRTTDRLKEMFKKNDKLVGLPLIEVNTSSLNRNYFFNPGYFKTD